jgi:hypothetical protein
VLGPAEVVGLVGRFEAVAELLEGGDGPAEVGRGGAGCVPE